MSLENFRKNFSFSHLKSRLNNFRRFAFTPNRAIWLIAISLAIATSFTILGTVSNELKVRKANEISAKICAEYLKAGLRYEDADENKFVKFLPKLSKANLAISEAHIDSYRFREITSLMIESSLLNLRSKSDNSSEIALQRLNTIFRLGALCGF